MKKSIYVIAFTLISALVYSCDAGNTAATTETSKTEEVAANQDLENREQRDATVKSMAKTTVEVDAVLHDFGKIKDGEHVRHTYSLKNTGTEPFMISNVLSPCGCTVPSYSKKPVLPGESASIEIEFNSSNKKGGNEKYLDVESNAATPIKLGFKAEVL